MTGVVVLLALLAFSGQEPGRPADPRLRTVPYAADQVVRLPVAANHHTAILFGPEERVRNVAIGDNDAWQATLNDAGDALFLKPLRTGGSTNMTVLTDTRVYSFELVAGYGASPDAPFAIRFAYPEPPGLPNLETGEPRLGRYRLDGARRLRPVAVIDDGVRTSIEWRTNQSIPAISALDDTGAEILVEGQMRNGLYVIDGVHQALIFRIDRHSARATRVRTRASG